MKNIDKKEKIETITNGENSGTSSSSILNSKICMVCSDKALGYNFNAVTCESCKAFFRRNALSNKEFTCPFSENCEITIVTRRFCQKCRLEKCFKIGMKKEYIMSEEDKVLKRKKIEQNRAKKRVASSDTNLSLAVGASVKIKKEYQSSENESWSNQEFATNNVPSPNSSSHNYDMFPSLTLDSNSEEIVNRIVNNPTQSSQTIESLMKSPKDALYIMSKIIKSQADALKLISHFISSPGDALQIISKIMNSPLDALTVFVKFMSSPTDGLQIITKVISSPNDVLTFMQNLMENPANGLEIMNTFMSDPAEALKMVNRMMNNVSSYMATDQSSDPEKTTEVITKNNCNFMLKNMLQAPQQPPNPPEPCLSPPSSTTNCNHFVPDNRYRENDYVFDDIEDKSIEPNTIESILSQAIRLEYESPVHQQNNNSIELNDAERAKLNELIVANKALYQPVDEDLQTLISEECIKTGQTEHDPMLLRVINLTAIAIRRLIKMSKKISAFKNMCQEDQLALLKGGCTEMMILRSVIQYDCDMSTWKIPHSQPGGMSNLRTDVLKLAKGNVYQEHEQFIQTFDYKWRTDENIILIMCAITLFTPDRPKVVHSDVIKLEQNSYYYLLRRYLESIYQGCEARSTFLKLMQKISELHRLNDEIISVYLDVNPEQVEPLLREIFDLKVL